MNKSIKGVKKTSFYEFIAKKDIFFEIPCFQRNYSWEKQQCKDLFDDIYVSYKTGNSHYLGNLIYFISSDDDNRYILVDGQQRITTIFLLLCAMRDLYNSISVDDYLYNKLNGEYKVKLKQNFIDAFSFEEIVKHSHDDAFKQSTKIVENYSFFKSELCNHDIDIKKFYQSISNLEIVSIELESEELNTIQTVFEKINSTGKGLNASDLIRNMLLNSNSLAEQQRLYNTYWIILEKILNVENKDDNISDFVKDYLILKKYKDIKDDNVEVYREFKQYYFENALDAEGTLKELIEYSKIYMLITDYDIITQINYKTYEISRTNLVIYKSDNSKKNMQLHNMYYNLLMLEKLNTEEQIPFFMQIFKKLYEQNNVDKLRQLNKILDLFCDFMIRYRIVGNYRGGGALSTAIHSIMKRIDNNSIACNYDSILFELSNSPNTMSEYPSDEKFKNALINNVSDNYAKILLYKMELKLKNIPVELKNIQIEHLMPQTLDSNGWWERHLGGQGDKSSEKAREIHESYINCIGNLALISPDYNKENSNKPWDFKVSKLKYIQFYYTNRCCKYKTWKKKDICNRNEYISKLACEKTITPLNRTRKIKNDDLIFKFNSVDKFAFSSKKPNSIIYKNNRVEIINNWIDVIPTLFRINDNIDIIMLNKLIESNSIHKNKKIKGKSEYYPILSKNKGLFVNPTKVAYGDLIFYVEGTLSSERVLEYSEKILKKLGLINDYSFEIRN